jgi:hypothetical protein
MICRTERIGRESHTRLGRATDVDSSRVETREDFARFLSALLADFLATGASEWENGTLGRFLDAFAAIADARRHCRWPVAANSSDNQHALVMPRRVLTAGYVRHVESGHNAT